MKPHTLDELNELKVWFDSHEVPESLQVDKSTYIPNVRKTVNALLGQAQYFYSNPKMQGGIMLVEKIKSILENDQSDK